jgi:hypothetical protein
MVMKKFVISVILVFIMVASVFLSGCVLGEVITGSKNLATEEFNFSDFTRVEVGSAFQVEIIQSSSYSVSITADDNLFDFIQVSKAGKTLKIRLKSGYNYQSITTKAKITMPELYELGLSGATHGSVEGFETPGDFELDLSGASELIGSIAVNGEAQFNLSGASKLELIGSANNVTIKASGASDLRLADFSIHDADIGLSGASDATVNLDGTLDANLSGASHLRYIGKPTTENLNISGGSEIENIP